MSSIYYNQKYLYFLKNNINNTRRVGLNEEMVENYITSIPTLFTNTY